MDGDFVGVINCVLFEGEVCFNFYVGGWVEKVDFFVCDCEICEWIGFFFKECGLIFVGIDVIGDYLIEINVMLLIGI